MIYNYAWEYDFIPYIPLGGASLNGDVTSHNLIPVSQRGVKALLKPDVPVAILNGDVSENNLAYVGNGATVAVDSTYTAYGTAALNDGYIGNEDNANLIDWSKICWVSAETAEPHWIEITIASPQILTSLTVEWALDGGAFFSSRKIINEAFISGAWTEIGNDDNIPDETAATTFELNCPEAVTKVRVYQNANDGPFGRPKLLWVSEVSIYA
jgi:hypothetical protein